jgi:hypothetical protein
MEASMDLSGKGSRSRRILPIALAGVGVYAAVAYGRTMIDSAPANQAAQRVASTDPVVGASEPAATAQVPGRSPVGGALQQVGAAGRDVLPGDATAVMPNLNSAAATAGSAQLPQVNGQSPGGGLLP